MSAFARLILISASLILTLATALGAYASHGLDTVLEPQALRTFNIAVNYQFFHGLGLLGLALLIERHSQVGAFRLAAALVFAGLLLFSSGLIASSLDGPRLVRSLAPVGGVALIVGWLICAVGAVQLRK